MKKRRKDPLFNLFSYFVESKYVFLFLILAGFLARVFNLHRFLGFYFDQGRDALVIWNFIKDGKFFLIGPTIGPTMGVGDVPRGPWYLWILIPFYWLGKGNPVFASWFLVFSVVIAIYISYFTSLKIAGKPLGFLSCLILSFSFSLILSSHWLSNPTFMYLLSALFLWSLFGVLEGKRKYFYLAGFISGMSMHFGGAADVFYPFIVFTVSFLWSRKFINLKIIFYFLLFYLSSFLPQIVFDIRHQGVIRKGLIQFFSSNRSLNIYFWEVLKQRLSLYVDNFSEVVWGEKNFWFLLFFAFLLLFSFLRLKEIIKNRHFLVLLISIIIPLLGMLFLRGEKGVIYGYYFTGYYLYFGIFFSFLLLQLLTLKKGCLVIFCFVLLFLGRNFYLLGKYFIYDFRRYNPIILEDQIKAVDWVYKDAEGNDFNVDFYVPPVIPCSYEYLFEWRGSSFFGKRPLSDLTSVLYTIQEPDDLHPERLDIWRKRQDKLGELKNPLILALFW